MQLRNVLDLNNYLECVARSFAWVVVALSFAYILNSFLGFWLDWPGVKIFFSHLGLLTSGTKDVLVENQALLLSCFQFLIYCVPPFIIIGIIFTSPNKPLIRDASLLSEYNSYIIRSFFLAVLLIGIVDMIISFLRVEGFLEFCLGEALATDLGRSSFRGVNVHYPLIIIAFFIGYFWKGLGFIWLAALIVVAEMQIVIARFVFSYEQAFMADLVRFWYGALFLFASPYTLVQEGHVRVDLFYAGFSARGKAWCNILGSILLGMPLCWVILLQGMWGRSNVISGPLLNYEVTQAGYGMYVKYLLAGFLLIFALSMLIQFMSYFLSNLAILRNNSDTEFNSTRKPALMEN